MKDTLIAERKALNEQIDKINARLREINKELSAIEEAERRAEAAKKIATATHTALRVSESYRSDPYSKEVYVRETPTGWRNVLDGELLKKSDDPTKSKEKREGEVFFARYVYLKDITPIAKEGSVL